MLRAAASCLLCAAVISGQVRKLHTRDFTRLSQIQIEDALRRSDVIFVPVGAVETNGVQPTGRDYVWPLAFSTVMAEEAGGLFVPGLVWSYPGTTRIAPSTIHIRPQAGTAILMELAHSLLRQGFRRQIYISASHGPAPLTVGTLVREFFEDTRVPILYINMDTHLPRLKLSNDERARMLYGAHRITGRLEDLPLAGEYSEAETRPPEGRRENEGLKTLGKLGFAGSLTLGSWIPDVLAHAGDGKLPASEAERAAWGVEGEAILRRVVQSLKIREAVEALRQHDHFTQEHIVPRFGDRLPVKP